MKKAIKVITYCLVVCGALALAICYMVIPQETKSAMDIVVEYLNKPFFIGCGVTITIGMVVGVILKLVYDRFRANTKEDLEDYKKLVVAIQEKAKDYEKLANEHYNDLKALLDNEKARNEYLLKCLEKVCETMPNAKIKALGEQIKKGYEEEYGEEREETTND